MSLLNQGSKWFGVLLFAALVGGCATNTATCDPNNCPAGCMKKTNQCGAGDRCCDAAVPTLPCRNCTP